MKLQKSYVKWVVITIILGAIGSGFWEYILKPIALRSTSAILDVATLGIGKFKNSLYGEIALGYHEQPSLTLLSFLLGFLPGILGGIIFFTLLRSRINKAIKGDTEKDAMRVVQKKFLIFTGFAFLFMFTFALFFVTRATYINRAATHFNQLMAIAGPYLNEHDRLSYSSKFSQISDRDDYEQTIEGLRKVCQLNRQKTPEFNVW